jgi:outer membrane lipoprotein-sorting protein
MKPVLIILSLLTSQVIFSQNANSIVRKMYNQFRQVNTYTNDVNFEFDIPNVNIKNLSGMEYFKAPNKYRVKLNAVAFVPVQNSVKIYNFLKDSSKYTALYNSTETVANEKCFLVHIIPNEESEMILGKLWISQKNYCPYKIVLTTKMGTIRIENSFGKMVKYGLPDKLIFYLDNFKGSKTNSPFKKKSSNDKKSEDRTGTIKMTYSNYKINVPIADSVFLSTDKKAKEKKI